MWQGVYRWHQLWKGGMKALETLPRVCFCLERHLVMGSEWTWTPGRARLIVVPSLSRWEALGHTLLLLNFSSLICKVGRMMHTSHGVGTEVTCVQRPGTQAHRKCSVNAGPFSTLQPTVGLRGSPVSQISCGGRVSWDGRYRAGCPL